MIFLKWILALPFIVGAVLFALAHGDMVTITWSPFEEPVTLPLYFVSLAFLGAGFLLGALIMWLSMGKLRQERRTQKKRIKQLEKDINDANEKVMEILAKQKTSSSRDALLINEAIEND